MKFSLLIFSLTITAFANAQQTENSSVPSRKLYNVTFRLPFVFMPFQSLSFESWSKINPGFKDLSLEDPSWHGNSNYSNSGYSGGTGLMAGLNFSPGKQTGNNRLVYGAEIGFLPGQRFETYQSKNFTTIKDTISFSSGQPDQYVVSDSTLGTNYTFYGNRIVLAPRIGLYFNQLKRLGFGIGATAALGISVENRISRVSDVAVSSSIVSYSGNADPRLISYDGINYYDREQESYKVRSTGSFAGGIFAEISYRLGKTGSSLEPFRIGLDFQGGMIISNLTKGINKTTPYYAAGLVVAYSLR